MSVFGNSEHFDNSSLIEFNKLQNVLSAFGRLLLKSQVPNPPNLPIIRSLLISNFVDKYNIDFPVVKVEHN